MDPERQNRIAADTLRTEALASSRQEVENLTVQLNAAEALIAIEKRRSREKDAIIAELKHENKLLRILVKVYESNNKLTEEVAFVDEKTGILNDKGFFKALRENQNSGVFILVDANKFKPINDTFGHKAGDRALRGIADQLKELFGEKAIVGRIGGDEFAVFVEAKMEELEQKLPRNEQGDPYIIANYTVSEEDQTPQTVTASIGMQIRNSSDNLDDIVKRADANMYESKRKGEHRESEEK